MSQFPFGFSLISHPDIYEQAMIDRAGLNSLSGFPSFPTHSEEPQNVIIGMNSLNSLSGFPSFPTVRNWGGSKQIIVCLNSLSGFPSFPTQKHNSGYVKLWRSLNSLSGFPSFPTNRVPRNRRRGVCLNSLSGFPSFPTAGFASAWYEETCAAFSAREPTVCFFPNFVLVCLFHNALPHSTLARRRETSVSRVFWLPPTHHIR